MPSSAQVVPVVVVYDYELKPSGGAAVGELVTVTFNYNQANSITPQTVLVPMSITTTTDANGYWQVSVIPNTNINPANTLYDVRTPSRSYQITVGAVGPYQSTAAGTIVNAPVTLSAATTSVLQSLTIAGNLAFSGSAAPTAGTLGANVSTVTITGNNSRGVITITAGVSNIGQTTRLCVITFSATNPHAATPVIMLTNASQGLNDATHHNGGMGVASASGTGFDLVNNGSAVILANAVVQYDYLCVE